MDQDFGGGDPFAPHREALGGGYSVHPIFLVIAVALALCIFWLMNVYYLEPGARRRRREQIYDAIAKAAKAAAGVRGMGALGAAQNLVNAVRGTLPHTFKLVGGLNGQLKPLEEVIKGRLPRTDHAPPSHAPASAAATSHPAATTHETAGGGTTLIINNLPSNSAAASSGSGGGAAAGDRHGGRGHDHGGEHDTAPTPDELARAAERLISEFQSWWGQRSLRMSEIEAAQNELA